MHFVIARAKRDLETFVRLKRQETEDTLIFNELK